ncbi:hypothetical protein D3C76_973710 [compost metagenome]
MALEGDIRRFPVLLADCSELEADWILAQLAQIATDAQHVVGALRMVQLHLVKL